ncbi:MAG: T9SS type A sorting domain-containing protein [bacterium]
MTFRIFITPLLGWAAAFLGMLLTVSTAAAQLTFTESDFDAGSFTEELVQGGSGGGSIVAQLSGDGNPSPALTVRHDLPAGAPAGGFCASWVWTFFKMAGAVVDPAAEGVIVTLDFSIDSAPLAGSNPVQSERPMVRQNDRLYVAGFALTSAAGGWSTHTELGLAESSFFEVVNQPPCEFWDESSHPDFSAQGAPIELGFARGNSTSVGGNVLPSSAEVGADNWSMTVHFVEGTAVPSPLSPSDPSLAIRPNPCRGTTVLSFESSRAQTVRFELFDVAGRSVGRLAPVSAETGSQSITSDWNAGPHGPLPAGVYFLRGDGPEFSAARRMVVIR